MSGLPAAASVRAAERGVDEWLQRMRAGSEEGGLSGKLSRRLLAGFFFGEG